MSDPVAAFLARRPVLVLDGGLASELQRRGADLADPLWSARVLLEQPGLIREVHRDYFLAGADVATTASYQATFPGLARRGIDAAGAAQLLRRSVALAVEARDGFWASASNRVGRERPLVAASIGPYGAMLADGSEYRGHYGIDEASLARFHRERIAVLVDAGADLLACETIPGLPEALVLARLLQEFPRTHAWISFSCRDEAHASEGQAIGDCARELEPFAQVVSVGVNCTPPERVAPLLRAMRPHTRKPLLAYPNSGERYDAAAKQWHADSGGAAPAHADANAHAPAADWYREGARLIGGCCRTTPADIAAIAAWAATLTRDGTSARYGR